MRRRVVCDSRLATVKVMRERKPLWRGPDTMSSSSFSVLVTDVVLQWLVEWTKKTVLTT